MSGEYPALLRKRALKALEWSKRVFESSDYDTAARDAEYAAQLYVRSVIYRVRGEEVRGHNLRELLGELLSSLMEDGLEEDAEFLADYLRKHRRELAELTEAHTRATYGLAEYGKREAELLLKIAESVIAVLKELEAKIFGGEV